MLVPALLVFTLAFVSNVNALSAGFLWDDRALVVENIYIKQWSTLPALFTQPFLGMYYRPVVMVSFALDYALWGLKPWGFHLTNLLLHGVNSVLVLLLLKNLSRSRWIALVAALLFACHPAHKGIVNIADRTGVLSVLFFLASLVAYVRFCRRADSRYPYALLSISWILCGFALFSKEEVVSIPLMVILLDAFMSFDGRPTLSRIRKTIYYGPFFLLVAGYLWVRSIVLDVSGNAFAGLMVEPLRRLITIPAILLDYLSLFFFPFRLDYEPRTHVAESIWEPRILLPLLILMVVAGILWRQRKSRNVALFGLLWYFITFIPMSNIVPIYPEAASSVLFTPIHFLYLPSIGVSLCVAFAIRVAFTENARGNRAASTRALATGTLCCVIFLFSLLSAARNSIWKDELRLYRYIVGMHPENPRMRLNLGNVYLERGDVDAALLQLEQAVRLEPDVASYHNSLALAYQAKGWPDKAVEQLRETLRLDPDSGMAYANLSTIYRTQGRFREAIASARKAVELLPHSAAARVNLALAYKYGGNLTEAENQFKLAIANDPDNIEAHLGLGTVYALQQQYHLARKEWEHALRISPDVQEAHENLRKLDQMGY
jgi:Tfp pilus assembly protein PilF